MTGQDAIKSAGEFHRQVGLTGVVMSKMDGDSRGGAALSVVSVVGVPVVFGAMGERVGDIEVFRPERMVSRILGMGDVLSLVERAEQVVSERDAGRLEDKIRRNRFTLQDFRDQLVLVGRMGPIERLVEMMPGVPTAAAGEIDPSQLTRCIAIIDSMTPFERRSPTRLDGNRRKRVARGSGTNVQEVNKVLKQFVQMQKMLKSMGMTGGRRFSRRGLSKAR
jgi:signal recognition particle subunit SRP54